MYWQKIWLEARPDLWLNPPPSPPKKCDFETSNPETPSPNPCTAQIMNGLVFVTRLACSLSSSSLYITRETEVFWTSTFCEQMFFVWDSFANVQRTWFDIQTSDCLANRITGKWMEHWWHCSLFRYVCVQSFLLCHSRCEHRCPEADQILRPSEIRNQLDFYREGWTRPSFFFSRRSAVFLSSSLVRGCLCSWNLLSSWLPWM